MARPDDHTRCHAIVLAAGAATRFDGAKLLTSFRGRPLINWSVEAALASPVESVTVVLGSRADAIEKALAGSLAASRMKLVRCAGWQDGISASLRCGLASLPPDCRAILIFLGDMPNIDASMTRRLLGAVIDGAPAALPEFAGVPGHPVAIASVLFDQLRSLDGDRGARAVLARIPDVIHIPVDDPGCIQDIDTKEDIDSLA